MARVVSFDELLASAGDLLKDPQRKVLAIAGAPGSGKSTLAAKLVRALDSAGPGTVAEFPMDGFHFDDAVLHARGRRPWKGAPDTFDVGGLAATLKRLRDPAEGDVAVPVFDRDLEISRGSARIIGADVRLIVTEGNYLLLDEDPWRGLAPYFDLTVMVDVAEDELRRRLRKRWKGFGLSPDEIDFKLDQNDMPNGVRVMRGSVPPALIFRQ